MLRVTDAGRGESQPLSQYAEPAPRGQAVWKQMFSPLAAEVEAGGVLHVSMPAPAEILCLDWEGDRAVVFVRVSPGQPYVLRRLLIAQTHRENLPAGRYLGTTRNPAGCAFHLFELG